MPQLRKDPITGRWVIIAEGRAARPNDFDPVSEGGRSNCSKSGKQQRPDCPFCEGNEHETPNEVIARREPGTQSNAVGWSVRVVPNKFPALEIEGGVNGHSDAIYRAMPGVGVHEVIIESPKHLVGTSELSVAQLRDVFWMYRSRLQTLKEDSRLAYAMVFKNVGAAAGASLEHLHSQLIALPIVPTNVLDEMNGSLSFYDRHGCCVYCDMVERELAAEERIVLETPGFVALTPFASRFPYETWVVPKIHAGHYEEIRDDQLDDLAEVMGQLIGKLESMFHQPAYNYIIHTTPFDTKKPGHYHWHIEVMPSLTKIAGFEWGTGFHINPVPPEQAASMLREIQIELRP